MNKINILRVLVWFPWPFGIGILLLIIVQDNNYLDYSEELCVIGILYHLLLICSIWCLFTFGPLSFHYIRCLF